MLATTQWPLERAVHLTSLVWVCVLWLPESLMDLSALCCTEANISFWFMVYRLSIADKMCVPCHYIYENTNHVNKKKTWSDANYNMKMLTTFNRVEVTVWTWLHREGGVGVLHWHCLVIFLCGEEFVWSFLSLYICKPVFIKNVFELKLQPSAEFKIDANNGWRHIQAKRFDRCILLQTDRYQWYQIWIEHEYIIVKATLESH